MAPTICDGPGMVVGYVLKITIAEDNYGYYTTPLEYWVFRVFD